MPKGVRKPSPRDADGTIDSAASDAASESGLLGEYRDKRRFEQTNEPAGPEVRARTGPTHGGEFVVHLHHASHVHYDLRLECGGALLSFAVPRGPSLDPAEKRLAMQTEAHPLGYLDFEDIIPAGNYGAGSMIVWDRGRVRYVEAPAEEGLRNGKLDLELSGSKLRGRFALVETTGRPTAPRGSARPWLFFKKPDAFARTADYDVTVEEPRSVLSGLTVEELARKDAIAAEVERLAAEAGAPAGLVETRRLVPMLCTQGNRLQGTGWLFELKLDGVRILADKQAGTASLFYRSSRDATESFPEIARAVRALAPSRVVLDGEIVAFDDAGKPSFQRLARRLHRTSPSSRFASLDPPVVFLVFDLLAIGAHDLRTLPLVERKALLRAVVPGRGLLRVLDHLEDDGAPLYALCQREKLEGVVAKKKSSPYRAGPRRTGEWVKVKCERDEDFVVIGWTVGENARERLGAVDLASYDGDRLVVRGKAGSGLDESTIDELLRRLGPLTIPSCAAEGELDRAPRGRTFVRPELVVNVRFLGWSDEGRLRFPVFRGVREDISPHDCTAAPPGNATPATSDAAAGGEGPLPDSRDAPGPGEQRAGADQRSIASRVKLTNRSKVFWPADGLTKGDLLDYYRDIAPTVLPYLRERPVVLVRYPDGIDGKHFYQWNVPRGTPTWVRTIDIHEHDGKKVTGFLVDDADTLLHIANLGCIPIHVMSTPVSALDRCDWLTIDFDLGQSPLSSAIVLAKTLRGLLDTLGLPGFPKTSGQRGLHVLVPTSGAPSDATKMLADLLGRLLVERHRDIATMERMVDARGGRVYVDTGQTGRGRTIVSPYSVRAYPGGRVSTPITWDEVSGALDPGVLTIKTVVGRVAERGDPMALLLEEKPDLGAVLTKMTDLLSPGSS